jgi:hypothetical protein
MKYWMLETINALKLHFYSNPEVENLLIKQKRVQEETFISIAAAQIVLSKYFKE